MIKTSDSAISEYIKSSPKFDRLNWWNLPDTVKLRLTKFPKDIKKLGNFVTIRRLREIKKKKSITKNISHIKKEMTGDKCFRVSFPIFLNNKDYAKLYALMISEGYYKPEFTLHVPEKEFHTLFKKCIENLISKEAVNFVKNSYEKGLLRLRAPAIIRHLIPLPSQIPFVIMNNKNLAREYLRVAFEAEGSPILNKKQYKRYIKLSRYTDITPFVSKKEKILSTRRLYLGLLKKKYYKLLEKIKNKPPKILLGEQILLKHHFDINSKLQLEAIRKNNTSFKCGKITARWVLSIYANNIDKFIKEIGFISKRKSQKLKEMKKIKGNNPRYFALDITKKISDKKYFYRKKFIEEMKKLGYKSPSCYLWRYCKNGLIKRVRPGYYKILF